MIVDLLGIQPVTPIKIQIENSTVLTEVLSTLATLAQSGFNHSFKFNFIKFNNFIQRRIELFLWIERIYLDISTMF